MYKTLHDLDEKMYLLFGITYQLPIAQIIREFFFPYIQYYASFLMLPSLNYKEERV